MQSESWNRLTPPYPQREPIWWTSWSKRGIRRLRSLSRRHPNGRGAPWREILPNVDSFTEVAGHWLGKATPTDELRDPIKAAIGTFNNTEGVEVASPFGLTQLRFSRSKPSVRCGYKCRRQHDYRGWPNKLTRWTKYALCLFSICFLSLTLLYVKICGHCIVLTKTVHGFDYDMFIKLENDTWEWLHHLWL